MLRLRPLPVCLLLLGASTPAWAEPPAAQAPLNPPPAQTPAEPVPGPGLSGLEPWLAHRDWTVRSIAAYGLRRRSDEGTVGLVTQALAREREAEQRVEVLGCLLAALAGRSRPELVGEGGTALAESLVALLDHPHPGLRARAVSALERLPTIGLGGRPELLKGWWERARGALAAEQAQWRARPRATPAAGTVRRAPDERETVAAAEPDLYAWVASLQRDGLDLVVVMDSTGSMGPVIATAKAQCQALVRRLRGLVPQFRAGLVTYDDGARLRVPLTVDAEELQRGLDRLAAHGGGDFEEGVDKGVALALRQDQVGWSRRAQRVIVVVGDAPPHAGDVGPLLKRLHAAGADELYEHPVTVHCLSTDPAGVDHFGSIARAGRGLHVSLGRMDRLAEELVLLSFGPKHRALAEAWLAEIDALREASPRPSPSAR